MSATPTIRTRRCTVCSQHLPEDTEHFASDHGGFAACCRTCRSAQRRAQRQRSDRRPEYSGVCGTREAVAQAHRRMDLQAFNWLRRLS